MVNVTHPSELSAVAERLRGLVAGIDPAWVTAREAPGLCSGLEDIRRLASGAQVVLAGLVDESDAPAKAGLRNGAEWMAQCSGGSLRSGYDAVATAKRLADLPDVTAALQEGRLSVVQASAIADAAAVDPSAATRLVDMAPKVSLAELRRECLRVKAVADPDPDKTRERIHRERRLRWFVDNEGAFNLSGRGPIEAGSEVATVLAPIIEDIFATAREAGITEPRDVYTWDGLREMARMAWAFMHGQSAADFADDDDHDDSADGVVHGGLPDTHGDVVAEPHIPDGGYRDDSTGVDDPDPNTDTTTEDSPDVDNDNGPADRFTGTETPERTGSAESTDPDRGTADDHADEADDADRADNAVSGGDPDGVHEHDHDPKHGAQDADGSLVGRPRKRRRSAGVNPWVRMSVRVDYAALVRGWVEGDEVCDIPGVGPISVWVARDLLGDAVVHLLVTTGRDATVAYLGRGQNTAQKIASAWTQSECQRQGCHRPVMEWDHRQPYATHRVTEIGNMQGLCRLCHRLKTRFGWELVDGVGKREMVPPSDPRHPANTRTRDGPADPAPEPAESPTAAAPDSDELMLFDEAQPGDADAASRSLLSPVSA